MTDLELYEFIKWTEGHKRLQVITAQELNVKSPYGNGAKGTWWILWGRGGGGGNWRNV